MLQLISRSGPCLCAIGVLALGAALAGGGAEVPVVVAEFVPAQASTWLGWRSSIFDDGYAVQSIRDPASGAAAWHERRVPRIRPVDLQVLLRLVEVINLDGMAAAYRIPESAAAGSGDTLRLTLRTRDGTRTVALETTEYAVDLGRDLEDHAQRERIRELLRVWRKALSLVRSPNREQTAKVYRD